MPIAKFSLATLLLFHASPVPAQDVAEEETSVLPPIEIMPASVTQKRKRHVRSKQAIAPRNALVQPNHKLTPVNTAWTGAPNVAGGSPPIPAMASEMIASGKDINDRPVTRPGEVLEVVPGLIVTQHSGEGKANQYFLRGYNLDHGTDMAITVDDMPVNMRSHAHGQGYADLNFLMPETVNGMRIRKGPYYADEGDFSSAGALHLDLIDRVSKGFAEATFGSFGYRRVFGMNSAKVGAGDLLFAGEANTYNGPWSSPDEVRKLNTMIRYTQGTATDGFSTTAMAYGNRWNSTDQVPLRAITSGLLGRFDSEDPSDGGRANRFSLSTRVARTDDLGSWKANAYVIKSGLDLYNNFTYYLSNPVLGDQFHQHDDRMLAGDAVSRTIVGSFAGIPAETTVGLQTRYDDISLALTTTYQRSFLDNIRSDRVKEASAAAYLQNTMHWTDWFRTTLGWRGDYYNATVNSLFDANNSGKANAAMGSPKFSMMVGPFYKTEFFFGVGMGMHSNDARGSTIREAPVDRVQDPNAPSEPISASPLLVRTKGAEVGIRTRLIPGLDSTFSVFMLDQASEIVFVGDGGDTEASRASHRYGIEWTNKYKPVHWLTLDGDVALSHARFVGFDQEQADLHASLAGYPEAQIGNMPGNRVPGSPTLIASAGITLGEATGWFGGLRWRYLGERPLTEDNVFRSPATSLFNGRIGYRFESGWRIQLDVLNLFDTKADQITYAYGSMLKTDSLFAMCKLGAPPAAVCSNGVMDRVLHPVEPLAVRLTLAGRF
ncbi:TonB-dependent hemoglobin/transferrin/lactoferrin receptor family protein [Afipia felis]|uniref:TonB-dependent hemoglobin/transferrin/lactoferrin receptor family protein n=2 Tax=Afipia felis TaxID=1035 RepID=A0A090MMI2_AFIFE|nr:TonB-dependent hemoglobin/transferrin/lactoferrin receptor family protein [Afipia felis]